MATAPTVHPHPTAADVRAVERALSKAYGTLEPIEWAATQAHETDGPEYTLPVTFETMGMFADVRAVLDTYIEEFQGVSKAIDAAMFSLSAIRSEQEPGGRAAQGSEG